MLSVLRRPGRLTMRRPCEFSTALFDQDIELTPDKMEPNRFTSFISKNWSVGNAPNGGYLTGMCLNAAMKVSPFPQPLSLSTHFVSKATEGAPADVTVATLNVARSSATLQITLSQEGRARCVMIGTFGSLKNGGVSLLPSTSPAPDLPPVAGCACATDDIIVTMKDKIQLAKQFKFFTHKDAILFQPSSADSKPYMEGWLQFKDGRSNDNLSSLFFLDCLPPPVINVVPAPWFPTLEYTVHFWGNPAEHVCTSPSEPLRCRFSSNHIENGTFYTDAELFSFDGTKLIAKSRQLARIILDSGKNN